MIVANQKISEHVRYAEVRCRCHRTENPACDGGHVRREVLDLFERLRERCSQTLGRDCPLRIQSGVRCPVQNLRIGGSPRSAHLLGLALDVRRPEGLDAETFHRLCEEVVAEGGLGVYAWGVHLDVVHEPPRRRWSG